MSGLGPGGMKGCIVSALIIILVTPFIIMKKILQFASKMIRRDDNEK